ncbi:FeoA family protein [Leptospira sp. 96542]|nr:FeoA family protein [Leptospira sp. 96542]
MNKLSEMKEGEMVEVISFDGNYLPNSMQTELLELGVFPGSKMKLVYRNRSLDKMIVVIGDTKIGIRLSDANFIHTKPAV